MIITLIWKFMSTNSKEQVKVKSALNYFVTGVVSNVDFNVQTDPRYNYSIQKVIQQNREQAMWQKTEIQGPGTNGGQQLW